MAGRVRLEDALSIGGGDVLVGAYARRLWRRRLLMGASGLGLVALAVMIYFKLNPTAMSVDTRPIVVRCVECQFEGPLRVPIDASGSFECPRCHVRGARELWACRKCGERLLAPLSSNPQTCPRCGGRAIGTAVGVPASQPAKTAASPK